ncbi:MAG: hypothetical protein ACREN7_08465, partial [Candidatus Dormibacteria bacterium]
MRALAPGAGPLTTADPSFGPSFPQELELLIGTLPPPLYQAVSALPSESGDLLEIVLDLGREPEARFEGGEVLLSGEPVRLEDLDYVC